jgi:type I restriction enzyme, S subunit
MNNGWQTRTLEEACQFSNGLWKGEKPPFVRVGVIRNTNFTKEGTLNGSDIAYLDVEAKKLGKRRLKLGDVILEKSGGGPKQPVGRVALFDKAEGDFSFSNFTAALRVRDPRELDFRFLHKFLHWTYLSGVTEGMQSHSTGIRNLDGDAYKAIRISFPPLPEQERIVGILDEAFEGIATAKANAEKNLQNARALFESHLQSVFKRQPDEVPVSALATDVTDGDHMPPPKASTGVPFITISDIVKRTRQVDFSNTFTVPVEYFQKLKPNKKPRVGDVLYTVTGATLGIPVLVGEQRDFCFQRHIGLIRPKSDTDSAWLTYALLSPQVFRQATRGSTGAAQKTVSLSVLRELKLPKLSFTEQKRIARELDAISAETGRLARLYERKLAALNALKKSLLHEAFAGQL